MVAFILFESFNATVAWLIVTDYAVVVFLQNNYTKSFFFNFEVTLPCVIGCTAACELHCFVHCLNTEYCTSTDLA